MLQIKDLKKIKRFNDIVVILAKYGFDEVLDRLDMPGSDLLHKISSVDENLDIYQRIRRVVEELGPTFIKFGQIMSLRPDLLPEELLRELEKLQDEVEPISYNEIEQVIVESLGPPISQHFSIFNSEPLAAASLSQVHRAKLRSSDEEVIVKVQRPGIEKNILSDLDILESISIFLDQQFEELKCYELPELVTTVRKTLLLELDFTRELDNMNIARSYIENGDIYIPKAYKELSSKKLLVMEFFDGLKFKDITASSSSKRQKVAENGLHAATKQILEDGFFHADPHPGNLLIGDEMQLCFIDWGMVGRLTDEDRFELIDLLGAVVDKDSRKLTRNFVRICAMRQSDIDLQELERTFMELLDRYHSIPIAQMNIGSFLVSLLSVLRDFQLKLPSEYIIMIKALITADGAARLAYPDLNVIDEIKSQIHAISRKRYSPENVWKNIKGSLGSILAIKKELPLQLMSIIEKIEQGNLGVTFRLKELDKLFDSLENASNRLTIGIITGAIIIGSSMIITTGVKPFLFGYPALGVIGYLISVLLGLWLVLTILRNKRY